MSSVGKERSISDLKRATQKDIRRTQKKLGYAETAASNQERLDRIAKKLTLDVPQETAKRIEYDLQAAYRVGKKDFQEKERKAIEKIRHEAEQAQDIQRAVAETKSDTKKIEQLRRKNGDAYYTETVKQAAKELHSNTSELEEIVKAIQVTKDTQKVRGLEKKVKTIDSDYHKKGVIPITQDYKKQIDKIKHTQMEHKQTKREKKNLIAQEHEWSKREKGNLLREEYLKWAEERKQTKREKADPLNEEPYQRHYKKTEKAKKSNGSKSWEKEETDETFKSKEGEDSKKELFSWPGDLNVKLSDGHKYHIVVDKFGGVKYLRNIKEYVIGGDQYRRRGGAK